MHAGLVVVAGGEGRPAADDALSAAAVGVDVRQAAEDCLQTEGYSRLDLKYVEREGQPSIQLLSSLKLH